MLDHDMSDKYKICEFEHALYISALNKIVFFKKVTVYTCYKLLPYPIKTTHKSRVAQKTPRLLVSH